MFKTFFQQLQPAFRFLPYLFKTSWYWILLAHLISFSLTFYFKEMGQVFQMNSQMNLLCRLGEFSVALSMSLFYALLVPGRFFEQKYQLKQRSIAELLKIYTVPLVLEGFRMLAKILVWSVFLVLPGIFQYWRLSLVPLIVMLNKDYAAGNVDALKHSHDLIRGNDFSWVLILAFCFTLDSMWLIWGILPQFPEDGLQQLILSFFALPFSLYSYSLLVHIYNELETQWAAKAKMRYSWN